MKQNLSSKKFRNLFALMVLLFMGTSSMKAVQSTAIDSVDWVLHSEQHGVKMYYKNEACDGRTVLLIKFENTTASVIKFNYHLIFEGPGSPAPNPHVTMLQANESKEGACHATPWLTYDISGPVPVMHFQMTLIP